jgi:release factor glutamine methyltransferase
MNIRQALARATARLAASDNPRLDAEILLGHVLGKPRSHLAAWPEKELGTDHEKRFLALVDRRAAGHPVAYLTGRREFWSLELEVTPATLIPRPETELLVELALRHLPPDRPVDVADLGTGSGAIALAIASERPRARIIATDRCGEALAIAQGNARRLGIGNVQFISGNWCEPLQQRRFELIVCNPPYIEAADAHLRQGDLRFEPPGALASGDDGLDDIRHIAACATGHLVDGGMLALEHGWDQGGAVSAILSRHGYERIRLHRDLAGHGRVTTACLKS